MTAELKNISIENALEELRKEAPRVDREAVFPKESLEILAKAGLMGLLVPESLGGADASFLGFSQKVMEIASCCASTAMVFVMHCCATTAIRQLMPAEQRDEILRAMARGKHLATLSLSERATGIHANTSFSTSREHEGGFLLNAEKVFVTSGGYADSYVVTTQAVESNDPSVTSIYLVLKGSPGQSFNGKWEGLGLRGNASCGMTLTDCFVPASHLLGESGKGVSYSETIVMPRFLLGSASVYAGIAKGAFEAACKHVKNRSHAHTKESLADLPTIRQQVAEMKLALDQCINFIENTAKMIDDPQAGPELPVRLMESKLSACKVAKEVCSVAMHICGGIAYSGVLPVERHFRDALAGAVMAPSVDALLDMIGRAALEMPPA